MAKLKFKVGDVVMITKDESGHGFPKGTYVKIQQLYEACKDAHYGGSSNNFVNPGKWYFADSECKAIKTKKVAKTIGKSMTAASKASQDKLLEAMVYDTAIDLLAANNTVTTLEIKVQLRKDCPTYYWQQNTKNGVIGVSEHMDSLTSQGFFKFKDTGTYRVYSEKKSVLAKIQTAVAKVIPKASRSVAPKKSSNIITPSQAVKYIAGSGGRFFTVEFIKKGDGTPRKMNCSLIAGQTLSVNASVKVKETTKAKYDPNDSIRQFDPKTLTSIKILGNTYKVK